MAATAKAQLRKTAAIGDRWRALVVTGLLVCFGALALTVGMRSFAVVEREPASPVAKDIRTGKLIITPQEGNECRQKQFDNTTGQFRDLGTLPCDTVANSGSGNGGVSRLEAVRNSFRR